MLALASPGLGHEQRRVGTYTLEVGWRDEPALEGALNAVQLEVRDATSAKGIEGLAKTVRAIVSFGGSTQTLELALEATPSQSGVYVAPIIPTRTGDYLFRITGKIEDLVVDERFESGPGRFDVVRSPASLQFPDQIGSAAALARDQRAIRELAEQTRLLAFAGIGLSVIAVGLGAVALRRR